MNDREFYLYNLYLTIKPAIQATPEHQRVAAIDRQLGGTGEYDRDCYLFNSRCIEADIAAGRIAAPTTEAEWVSAYVAWATCTTKPFGITLHAPPGFPTSVCTTTFWTER